MSTHKTPKDHLIPDQVNAAIVDTLDIIGINIPTKCTYV